jgi:hypothetical protein
VGNLPTRRPLASGHQPRRESLLVQAAELRDEQKGNASIDGDIVIQDPLALSSTLMTEERAYMARWLALEVLMTDETVCEDEELYGRLSVLQEKWQEETLARHGITSPS